MIFKVVEKLNMRCNDWEKKESPNSPLKWVDGALLQRKVATMRNNSHCAGAVLLLVTSHLRNDRCVTGGGDYCVTV